MESNYSVTHIFIYKKLVYKKHSQKKFKIRNLNLNNVQVKKLAKSGFVSFLGHTRARGIVGNHLPAMTKSDRCLCGVKTPAPE